MDPEARARQPLEREWGGLLYRSDCEGIPVYHASIPVKGSRVGARLLDYARFHAISTLAGLTLIGHPDVILAPSPPLTIGLSAWALSLARRAPFIYNVQEIYPDVAVSLGVLKNRRMIRAMESLERFIYARSRVVTVISEWFRRRLLTKGVPAEKLKDDPELCRHGFHAARTAAQWFFVCSRTRRSIRRAVCRQHRLDPRTGNRLGSRSAALPICPIFVS